jgi:hypothetical protein
MLHKFRKSRSIALLALASTIAGSTFVTSARSAQAVGFIVSPVYTFNSQPTFTTKRPDLKILNVLEVGSQATVQIRNIGTGNSPASVLRVYRWNGAAWVAIAQVNVNALPVSTTVNVAVAAPQIVQFPTKYVIDPDNNVVESNENNNHAYDIDPAG